MSAPKTKLVLGGIVFRDFEIPERISFGQAQSMHVHKLVGGSRVVDCMGPDPKPISWNGRFRDADAPARARSVEHLCASGALVGVSWGSFFYMVVVSEFECDYESRREIPYKVTLTVVPSFLGSQFASISALISSDLTALSGLGALL